MSSTPPTHECSQCYIQGSQPGIKNHIRARHGGIGNPLLITADMKARAEQRKANRLPRDIHKAVRDDPQAGNNVACNACRLPSMYRQHTCGKGKQPSTNSLRSLLP